MSATFTQPHITDRRTCNLSPLNFSLSSSPSCYIACFVRACACVLFATAGDAEASPRAVFTTIGDNAAEHLLRDSSELCQPYSCPRAKPSHPSHPRTVGVSEHAAKPSCRCVGVGGVAASALSYSACFPTTNFLPLRAPCFLSIG